MTNCTGNVEGARVENSQNLLKGTTLIIGLSICQTISPVHSRRMTIIFCKQQMQQIYFLGSINKCAVK
jgi:hypothetical protein